MKIRRMDLVLAALVLTAAGVLYLLLRPASQPGGWVVVTVDGAETGRYPLSQDQTVRIGGDTDYNILEIRDGTAAVTQADCGDHTCVRTGAISRSGQSIICLPHKVVVQIEGAAPSDVDAVLG